MSIRIGTRGSQLALWQAHHVEKKLQDAGYATEIVTIETKGDKILDVSISKIGSKGVFTEEIEAQLENGQIDIAVHSAKDMQSTLPEGFELIAFMEREKPNDVIISHKKNLQMNGTTPFVLGTSSTRRVATLKHLMPAIETTPVRGNLQTRIRKMKEGACDALLLAYAGVHRMGYEDMIVCEMPLNMFIPAVGQGSVAIEVHESLENKKSEAIRSILNHETTEQCIRAERSFLKVVDGGCSIPVFALAQIEDNQLSIEGGIISLDGSDKRVKKFSGEIKASEELGRQLAEEILSSGGERILKEIKNKINEK
ncbi:hydroxymethylbilane synthase [Roseivirga misakiensis]|uniref:Porphobilinogen deaminase n=1 Tax=Roseivirga misakiensis TaxID=1563681 RepID=A0A1E5T5K5_9BACT|nr:hydroxymethylbilane synthase [Roseivirga misakiensis]OEK06636.1 hydroxymethylbilane synthase [Roseivirga misakiensis]